MNRPRGPFVPGVVGGTKPDEKAQLADGHYVRTWTVRKPIDSVSNELSEELQARDGWQPAQLRTLTPKRIQFVRVKSPNGDFEFTRLTIEDLGNGTTGLSIDEEPKQPHAFK